MKHILVPLDTSETSARALDAATDFAARFGARITLTTVLDTSVRNGLGEAAAADGARIETAAATYLEAIAAELDKRDIQTAIRVVDSSDAAAAITDTADEVGADTIVLCTHGRTGAERWLLGSVTDRVIRSSRVPVHVIPVRR